jgi:hypothetical protein
MQRPRSIESLIGRLPAEADSRLLNEIERVRKQLNGNFIVRLANYLNQLPRLVIPAHSSDLARVKSRRGTTSAIDSASHECIPSLYWARLNRNRSRRQDLLGIALFNWVLLVVRATRGCPCPTCPRGADLLEGSRLGGGLRAAFLRCHSRSKIILAQTERLYRSASADFWSGAATVPKPWARARMMATRQLRSFAPVGFFFGDFTNRIRLDRLAQLRTPRDLGQRPGPAAANPRASLRKIAVHD